MIKLYDLRSFDKVDKFISVCLSRLQPAVSLQGPFATFQVPKERDCEWTGLKFSADGKTIMVTTNGNVIHLIDAFSGQLTCTFTVSGS